MANDSFDRFWSLPTGALLDRLATNPAGLSQIEAEERLARYGPNTVAEHTAPRYPAQLPTQTGRLSASAACCIHHDLLGHDGPPFSCTL
jgi:Cation transporter/ATPase, N-terminus